MSSPPAAAGVRLAWAGLVGRIRSAVEARAVDALLCAFAGFLAERCRRPAPPGLPTVRAYQRAYAGCAAGRLARRTGWDGSVWAFG